MHGLHLGLSGGKKYPGTEKHGGQEKILVHSKAGSRDYRSVLRVGVYSCNYGSLEE